MVDQLQGQKVSTFATKNPSMLCTWG